MRKLFLLALVIFSVLLSGCSFSTRLVVINRSDKPIELTYRYKDSPGSFTPERPKVQPLADLDDDDSVWRELPTDQYVVNSNGFAVTLTVAPKTAVFIDRVRGPGIPDESHFHLSDIVMRGAYGTTVLHGEQVRKSFVEVGKLYAISYR